MKVLAIVGARGIHNGPHLVEPDFSARVVGESVTDCFCCIRYCGDKRLQDCFILQVTPAVPAAEGRHVRVLHPGAVSGTFIENKSEKRVIKFVPAEDFLAKNKAREKRVLC